ncbi:MAG: hypothetical protein SNJ29_15860 [Rikenellaceae bacterium]
MINVEFDINCYSEIIITIDNSGVSALINQLSQLMGKHDHFHMFSTSWSTRENAELSEIIFSGKKFHWCHELAIGTHSDDIPKKNKNCIDVFVDIVITNKEYSSLQVSLLRTQKELATLLNSINQLSYENNNLLFTLNSQCEIKDESFSTKKHYEKLNLIFKWCDMG